MRCQAWAEGAQNFATYERSSSTGVDYADQRYYSGIHGRFLTADPYVASAGVGEPGSWNRYAYVEGDPVNFFDPLGLCKESATSTSVTVCSGPIPPVSYVYVPYDAFFGSPTYPYTSTMADDFRQEEDRQYRLWMEQLHEECITKKQSEIQQQRQEFIDAADDRILSGMRRGALSGAIYGAYRGAQGSAYLGGLAGGLPGALLGGLAGGVIGSGASVIRRPIEQAIRLALYDALIVGPALAAVESDCNEMNLP